VTTAAAPALALSDERALAERVCRAGVALGARAAERIVGLDEVVEQVLITLFTRNHALLEGVPGLAKTLLLSTVAGLLGLRFSRIQFTPDLMPSDVTGTEYLVQDADSGERRFRFAPGPVFANVVLADEINRAPPKTQAALMEAMEERQVTSLGVSRRLEDPFVVLATQNPIEQEGTYPLPAAQLDRFLFKVELGYPSPEDERRIARLVSLPFDEAPEPVLGREEFVALADGVARVAVRPEIVRYATRLAQASRPHSPEAPAVVREYVEWGAGPRAAQALVHGARARALLRGRSVASVEDIRALVAPVLRHRLRLSYSAEAEAVTAEVISHALLTQVEAPGGAHRPRRAPLWRRVLTALWATAPRGRAPARSA
jgi:MoxR-like ATPase